MKKIYKGSMVLLLMLSLIVTTKTTAVGSSDGIINGGVYKFVSKVSGKVMDVSGGSPNDGAKMVQWTSHDGTNQQFKFELQGDG